jgi:hypothetical protein
MELQQIAAIVYLIWLMVCIFVGFKYDGVCFASLLGGMVLSIVAPLGLVGVLLILAALSNVVMVAVGG